MLGPMEGDAWLEGRRQADGVTRLVSFNIRNGRAIDLRHNWWRRRSAVLESLQRLAPDVAGIQEAYAFQADWLCRRLPGYGSYGDGRNNGGRSGEQALVLFRHESFRFLHGETRWYGNDPSTPGTRLPHARFPRVATFVELERRPDRARLVFVNTHLDERHPSARLRSAQQLATWITDQPTPTAILGDLNEDIDGPALQALRATTQLVDAVPAGSGGSNHDFTGRADGRRLDHILVPESWRVLHGGVDHRTIDGRLASDHWPVVADVMTITGPSV